MREDQFQERVTDYCNWLRLDWYHANDPRRDREGFPDLVILGDSGVVFAELKSEKGRIREAQQHWHDRLVKSGAEAYIWRPSDWPEVQRVLQRIAGSN